MASQGFVAPIAPGKTAAWRAFRDQLNGPRRSEFEAQQKRLGLTRQTVWLQQTPMGDLVILYFEGEGPAQAMSKLAASTDPFDNWFKEQVKEVHGLDFSQLAAAPVPEVGVDYKA